MYLKKTKNCLKSLLIILTSLLILPCTGLTYPNSPPYNINVLSKELWVDSIPNLSLITKRMRSANNDSNNGTVKPSITYYQRGNFPILGVETQEIRIGVKKEQASTNDRIVSIQLIVEELGNYINNEEIKGNQQNAKKEWPAYFKSRKTEIENALEYEFGTPSSFSQTSLTKLGGKKYQPSIFTIDLLEKNNELLEINIAKTEDLNSPPENNPTEPRRDTLKNKVNTVQKETGEDVFVNVPMVDQGPRGYCAFGTLSMLAGYYGHITTIEDIALSDWGKAADALCRDCNLKMEVNSQPINMPTVEQNINRGEPIIISRWLKNDHTDGHSSLITGYSKESGEVLLTESWGEKFRNHRIKLKELQQNMWSYFTFSAY